MITDALAYSWTLNGVSNREYEKQSSSSEDVEVKDVLEQGKNVLVATDYNGKKVKNSKLKTVKSGKYKG